MKRLPMRKIREVLRLAAQGLTTREMASSLQIGRTTLREYLYRARSAGLSWPLADDLSDGDLERMLFPNATGSVRKGIPQPDWGHVHTELRRTGVTLSLLWEEPR
jgi:transposase